MPDITGTQPLPRSRRLLQLSLILGLLAWAILWGYLNRNDFQQLLSFHPWSTVKQIPLTVVSYVLIGMLNHVAAAGLQSRIQLREWVRVVLAASLANYIFPFRTGVFLRAAYLKSVHGLPISQFGSITGAISILTLLIASAFGSVIMLIRQAEATRSTLILSVFLNLTAVGCLTLWGVSFLSKRLEYNDSIPESVKSFGLGMNRLGKSPRVLAQLFSLSVCLLVVSSARIFLSYSAVGWDVSPLDCTLVTCVLSMSMLVAITPAGIGIEEGIGVAGSMLIGVPPEVSLAALLVNRGVSMVVVFTLGPGALASVLKRLRLDPVRAQCPVPETHD